MHAYLVRHGEAVPSDVDPERPLSENGKRQVLATATVLHEHGAIPAEIWHSPKPRARQTAEAIGGRIQGAVKEHPGLLPEDDPQDVALALEHAEGDVLIAGHLPHLSYLAAQLILGTDGPPFATFEPAAVMCLHRESAGLWTLRWFVSPAEA